MPVDNSNNFPAPLLELADMFKQLIEQSKNDLERIHPYFPADELATKLDLALSSEGCDDAEIIEALRRYLEYAPRTWRADFNKLLFSGLNTPGVLADWVSSISNTTMHTYQVAPVATLMERELIRRLNTLVGFDNGDGIMVSGGTMANMIAMMLARHKARPDIKTQGFYGQPLVAYVSEQAHYSFDKAANTLGIGTQNVVAIACDDQGRMLPDALAHSIGNSLRDNKQPFFIGLTAGTTVLGAFDPVAETAAIARRHELWLHIDGAWGAPILFSDAHKHLLADTSMADSFTWDAHKLMNVPLTASAILVKDPSILEKCCAGGGSAYLFHEHENTAYDLGKKSLQCGRRVDSLKFWLSWKAMGSTGYAHKIDKLMALKQYMLEKIEAHSALHLLAPACYLNILFRFETKAKLDEEALAKLNITICDDLLKQGLGFVDYAEYQGRLGIRFILANGDINQHHIDDFLAHCLRIGQSISDK